MRINGSSLVRACTPRKGEEVRHDMTECQRQKKRDRDNRYYATPKGKANRQRKRAGLLARRDQQLAA